MLSTHRPGPSVVAVYQPCFLVRQSTGAKTINVTVQFFIPLLFSPASFGSVYTPSRPLSLDTLYEHPKSRVEKSTPCLMCVCAQPYPLFHLHVWCYRVAAGRRVGGGWTGKPRCSSTPHRLLASNPLSCSGKSADSALFHPLSPNPAGCGSGGIILD